MPEGVGYGPQNTASTGLSLNVIGKHAYAYSGLYAASTTPITTLDFTTGNYYLVGSVQLNAAVDDDNASLSNAGTLLIQFNGISIGLLRAGADDAFNQDDSVSMDIIIPPYTAVIVKVDSTGTQSDRYLSAVITGKIYK